MLSKTGSNASNNNLRRAKSNTSVKERRKHPLLSHLPDPKTSKLHAQIAASKAMSHSNESAFESVFRSDSNASKKSSPPRGGQGLHFQSASEYHRQQSVLQSRKLRPVTVSRDPKLFCERAPPYEECLVVSDFGGSVESYGAEPSSYRRIKRAKSLLTPSYKVRQTPSSNCSDTPLSQAPTLRFAASTASLRESGLRLRLKKSFKLLKPSGRPEIVSKQEVPSLGSCPEAVMLARQEFFEQQHQQPLTRKVSQLFMSKTRREQKAFRKSVRTVVPLDTIYGEVSATSNPSVSKERSISSSLRNRFLKSFGKHREEPISFPPQQIIATRAYFDGSTPTSGPESGFDSYHDTDVDTGRRGSLYISSTPYSDTRNDTDSLSQQLRASASFESLHSISRSRVTSWTNSTATGSTRGTTHERKRLSIIKEDGGPHQPSSSVGRHIGGVSAFQQPLQSQGMTQVDSHRVYSALVKRIEQEQAEIQTTKAALEQIHEAEENINGVYLPSFPTIRAVESQSSVVLSQSDEAPQPRQSSSSRQEEENKSLRHQPEPYSDHVCLLPQPQDTHSNFFPFSTERTSQMSSPFRKLIQERKIAKENAASQIPVSPETINVSCAQGRSTVDRARFGRSSDSIYSKNTDGSINMEYISPIGSTEDFVSHLPQSYTDTGMATIICSSHGKSTAASQPSPRVATAISATASKKGKWRGWAESQMDNFGRYRSKASGHVRESTQINCEEAGGEKHGPIKDCEVVQRNPFSHAAEDDIPGDACYDSAEGYLNSALQQVSCSNIIVLARNSISRSQTGLVQQAIIDKMSTDNRQISDGSDSKLDALRKISPSNVARMLKARKSQPVLPPQSDIGKENKKSMAASTTPISTPGRLQLQMRSGNSTGRLRKRQSVTGQLRFKEGNSPATDSPVTEDSPSDRFRTMLSARLSRPFDMDVPELNRPFDSVYLGKGDVGFTDLSRDRLSVAPNAHHVRTFKSYGNLGPSPFDEVQSDREKSEETGETALPPVLIADSTENRATSFSSIATGSKRMVSHFLKSRRKNTETKEENMGANPRSSPMFL